MNPKQTAAERAATYVQTGMTVGLGSGSTAAFAIVAIGERARTEGLQLRCLATSEASATLARTHGLPLVGWEDVSHLDVTIDGADEVDPALCLIKGGGGAQVREKLTAVASAIEIIVVDEGKVKAALGAFPLPVAVLPWAWTATQARLETKYGVPAPRRLAGNGSPFVSDDGLFVLDMAFGAPLPDPATLEQEMRCIVGVADVGLFVGLCQRLVIGCEDGRVEERTP